ncbi:uncharacterized protein [Drosophila virilis]|uniref:Arrestin-like N-terminal domain-containing protein n=1 Tax=Drosophila virilis TaxID=7244 RepID=B4M4K3_DROVI|nr:uncharacterized protein LOC6632737 [Drosophila virilis]EDW59564.1 uncharacterized protein Dvir_GJ10217 [Drosophila virilis]
MPIDCQFNLSRASAVYYTGEQVSGSVALSASKKSLQLEAVSISLICRSEISWREADSSLPLIEHNDSTATTESGYISYAANKTHLQQTQQLLQKLNLPPGGTQRCSFQFELPHDLPGSCRLPQGATDYTLFVTLQRRGKHDKHFQQRLCIRKRIELVDLQPACNASATLRLSLLRSIFAPGQRVAYQLHATVPATCQTRLLQSITYQSQQPVAKSKRVQNVLDESCALAAALHLPLTAPIMTQLPGEPIEIAYYLETWSSCSEPLRLPLLVGTVAPPVDVIDSPTVGPSLGFVNLALCENDLLFSSINQLLPHSCSRESNTPSITWHGEHLKLLRRQKKQSYVRLALRFFYKNMLPTNKRHCWELEVSN